MTDEQFQAVCNVYGFAPSRSLRELLEMATAQAVISEREACAKVCEELRDDWLRGRGRYEFMGEGADYCADAIRARSQT
jgi:hypothetical protein